MKLIMHLRYLFTVGDSHVGESHRDVDDFMLVTILGSW